MASPIHPNEFALRQQVLFRQDSDDHWREGVIRAVSIDDRKTHKDKKGYSTSTHEPWCGTHVYVIDDGEDRTLTSREAASVTGCLCEVRVVDADSTGRWHGQRLEGPTELALLLFDMERRNSYVHLQPAVNTDPSEADRVMLLEVPGYHHLASASLDDLVAWASGIPAIKWKEPTECE